MELSVNRCIGRDYRCSDWKNLGWKPEFLGRNIKLFYFGNRNGYYPFWDNGHRICCRHLRKLAYLWSPPIPDWVHLWSGSRDLSRNTLHRRVRLSTAFVFQNKAALFVLLLDTMPRRFKLTASVSFCKKAVFYAGIN